MSIDYKSSSTAMFIIIRNTILLILIPIQLLIGQSFYNQVFRDSIYSIEFSNEQLLSNAGINTSNNGIPSIRLGSDQKLSLRFDVLNQEFKNYSYTLVHCNPDWTPSDIFTNDYLSGYNEENINEYFYSQNTSQQFVHYLANIPSNKMKITKSGNYVVLVYHSGDKNKIVLTQKFYVYENKVSIIPLLTTSSKGENAEAQHQINFSINQSNIASTDPKREFVTAVIKNNNYENLLFVQPTYLNSTLMTYTGTKLNFEAGNEFRQFDTRNININTNGFGVYKSMYERPFYHTILTPITARKNATYSQNRDYNGKRFLLSQSQKSNYTETDYTWVYFYLDYPEEDLSKSFYIWGELTNWEKLNEAKLTYNENSNQYVGKLFLKQGVYDYAILTTDNENNGLKWATVEGNYYQTENNYSIMVYHKNFNSNYFALVAIKNFNYK